MTSAITYKQLVNTPTGNFDMPRAVKKISCDEGALSNSANKNLINLKKLFPHWKRKQKSAKISQVRHL